MLHERLADVVGPRYAIERELPGGGMARVFLARDPLLDRRVVIKALPPELATAVGMERFQREARLLARLNHPHIIPILDTGHSHGLSWFAMPWIEGQTLAQRLGTGPLDPDEVRTIGLEILDALCHAHRLGVVHRDIKPANIFLHAGHALLADFGVAQLADGSGDALTDAGVAVGTLAYMSPEHARGAPGDPRSDAWELGATLYEACTGVRWTAASATPDPWHTVPDVLRPALQGALAARPADRWSDARAFGAALRGGRRMVGRPILMAALLGVIALALALALAWQRLPGRGAGASGVRDSVDVLLVADDGPRSLSGEVAHNAGLALEWLPMIRPSVQDSSAPPARFQVRIRSAVGSADTVLFVEGRNAAGVLMMNERVTGSVADPFTWGRSVADRVVNKLYPERTVDFRLLANSTDNVQALHAWYRGSAAFQAARWDEAEQHYAEALRHDPSFLAASWSMLLTTMWRREPYHDELHALLLRVEELPSTIGRLLQAQVEPHLPTRMTLLDSLAVANVEFAPARMLLANELFHRGPLVGRRLGEGVDAFVSAARDVPDLNHRTTWQHVLWGAIRLGDTSLANAAWRRLSRWPGDEELTGFLGLGLQARFSPADATQRGAMLERLAAGNGLAAMSRYLRLGLDFDIPDEVQRMAQLVAARATDPEVRASALATRATTQLMQGQIGAALASLDSAASVARDGLPYRLQAAEWRVLLPVLDVPVDPRLQADGMRDLRAIAADAKYWPRAAWALAVASLSTRGSLAPWGDSLSRGASRHPVAAQLLPLWRAQQSAAAMRPAEALDLSSAIHHDPGDEMVIARGPLARSVTYVSRGHWQLRLGDSLAAEREWRWHENNDLQGWPAGPPQDGELDAALSVLGRLLQSELLCEQGQFTEGRVLLARAEQLLVGSETALMNGWPIRTRAVAACQ